MRKNAPRRKKLKNIFASWPQKFLKGLFRTPPLWQMFSIVWAPKICSVFERWPLRKGGLYYITLLFTVNIMGNSKDLWKKEFKHLRMVVCRILFRKHKKVIFSIYRMPMQHPDCKEMMHAISYHSGLLLNICSGSWF